MRLLCWLQDAKPIPQPKRQNLPKIKGKSHVLFHSSEINQIWLDIMYKHTSYVYDIIFFHAEPKPIAYAVSIWRFRSDCQQKKKFSSAYCWWTKLKQPKWIAIYLVHVCENQCNFRKLHAWLVYTATLGWGASLGNAIIQHGVFLWLSSQHKLLQRGSCCCQRNTAPEFNPMTYSEIACHVDDVCIIYARVS